MTTKKPPTTTKKPRSQQRVVQDLAKRERAAVATKTKKYPKGRRPEPWPRLVTVLVGLVILGLVAALVTFQVKQQLLIDENKEQFIAIREVMKEIQGSTALSAPGAEWQRGESCAYSPGRFEITYEARIEWTCQASVWRDMSFEEDSSAIVATLMDKVYGTGDWSRTIHDSDSEILLIGSTFDCFVFVRNVEEPEAEGMTKRAGVRCNGGGYKSWYPNSEQNFTREGKDAWRSLKE